MSIAWVTGARGFIGQHLVRQLAQTDTVVAGLGHGALPPELAAQQGISHWINGDIDTANLQQLLSRSGPPRVIYHLAGGSSVGLSLQTPSEDFRRTVVAMSALLEWVRLATPQTQVVFASSAAVYGSNQLQQIPEQGGYTPYSPYGFHKLSAELLCQSYAQAFGLSIGIIRFFSVYGPGLRKQLLWDLCCRLQQRPQYLQMQGTGQEVRDWLYIEDAVRLLTSITDLLQNRQQFLPIQPLILNGGTGLGTKVCDIVKLLCAEFDLGIDVHFSNHQREGDPFSLVADPEILQSLGISLSYPLHQGIANYVQWFLRSTANR
jgi:UDP-glucose 4-epimerase